MKPIKFPEHTIVYAENQEEYLPLPAHINNSPSCEVTSCWHLSFWERIRLLFTGCIWQQQVMFRNQQGIINPLTPSRLTVYKDEVIPKAKPSDIEIKDIDLKQTIEKVKEMRAIAAVQFPDDQLLMCIVPDMIHEGLRSAINPGEVLEEGAKMFVDGCLLVNFSTAASFMDVQPEMNEDKFMIDALHPSVK